MSNSIDEQGLSTRDVISNALGVAGIGAIAASQFSVLQNSFFSAAVGSMPFVGNATNSTSLMPLIYNEAAGGVAFKDIKVFPNFAGKEGKLMNMSNSMKSAQELNNAILNSTRNLGVGGNTPVNIGKLFSAVNLAGFAYTGYTSYQEGGVEGLFGGLTSYGIGLHFGLENSYEVKALGQYTAAQQASILSNAGFSAEQRNMFYNDSNMRNGLTQEARGYKVSNPNSFFRVGSTGSVKAIPFVDRILGVAAPMIGAGIGASVGYSAGKFLGESFSAMLGADNSTMLGAAGGIFGAIGGAAIGGAAFSSIGNLAASAAIFGTSAVIGTVSSHLFSETMRRTSANRPRLDTAGDAQPYFTKNAVTMRQRALQAMNSSHTNSRSALGNEASIMHMNRDYFSNLGRL